MNNFDQLLASVRNEAENIKIPISRQISDHVLVNTRAKTRFGRCIKLNGQYTIELSSRLLEAPEKSCRQTIAHELIHTCRGCMNHGNMFKLYAEKMNQTYGYHITRTSSAEEMGVEDSSKEAKYIIVCKNCGKEIRRSRKSPLTDHLSRYRCMCGGELVMKGSENTAVSTVNVPAAKYVLLCTKCGKHFERERMSQVIRMPSRYRCSCGGVLKRIR